MDEASSLAATSELGTDVCFALRLDHLYPDRALNPEEIARDGVALLTALEGQHSARFVLQTLATPQPDRPESGSVEVHLVVALEDGRGRHALVEEIRDDLVDLLSAPPLRWSFSAVTDPSELDRVLNPFPLSSLAELARREEPCAPTDWTTSVGFSQDGATTTVQRGLWSMWTLGPAAVGDEARLASVLLAQEAPVCVRVALQPTALTAVERELLERLVMTHQPGLVEGLLCTSLRTLEALLYLRPVFDVRCVVASPERLSRSLLSALGHAISEPPQHGPPTAVLRGGFAVLRAGDHIDETILREAFTQFSTGRPGPSLAPEGLGRLRRLLGPWEAANVFRLPVADLSGVPGMTTLDVPDLPPPLSRLPREGRRLGQLAGHGELPVFLDEASRYRHMYVSGQTGTGKSTLLLNLVMQDIAAGDGVAVLDPHGDLVEAILERIPDHRIDDVVLVDPADQVAVVGVNLLEADSAVQAAYVVEELSRMFAALFDPNQQGIVGPRFESMLRQSANLLLASPATPSSMLDIATIFVDPAVRNHLVKQVRDPVLAEFWLGEMSMSRSNEWQEVVSWFRSKFEIFRTSSLVRNVVGQATSSLSFTEVLRDQRILLVNLSKGQLGAYNSALIGYITFARLWSAALERASMPVAQRSPFHVYIDEFQNMTNESLPSVLSEARKFGVSLTLANQFFTQVPEQTRDAIMGNVSSRLTFRLGPRDAGMFAEWLGRDVHADELTKLPNYLAIAALSESGIPLAPFALSTDAPPPSLPGRADEVRARSRTQWARPVDGLDSAFFSRWAHVPGSISAKLAADAAAPPPPPPPAPAAGSSFLDDWLKQRKDGARSGKTED